MNSRKVNGKAKPFLFGQNTEHLSKDASLYDSTQLNILWRYNPFVVLQFCSLFLTFREYSVSCCLIARWSISLLLSVFSMNPCKLATSGRFRKMFLLFSHCFVVFFAKYVHRSKRRCCAANSGMLVYIC